jgi:uncharacterized protein YkwD
VRALLAIAAATAILAAAVAMAAAPPAGAIDLGRLIAPASACSGAGDAQAPAAEQEDQMLCMTNYARGAVGRPALEDTPILDRSAERKSNDILRCDSFSHEACGRPFTFWMERVGYLPSPCSRAGENIAWGVGSLSTVRSIFSAWINSPGHRENILGRYRQIGIGLRVGGLEGYVGAHVWTQEFGLRC